MRLIDADALVKHCNGNPFITDSVKSYVQISVATMPTIEERKTGKWNRRKGMYEVGFKCSECNSFSIAETPYCSFCGSHMVQEGEEL